MNNSIPQVNVDLERAVRCGFPEVIYGEGKTAAQISNIATSLLEGNQAVFVTRLAPESALEVLADFSADFETRHNPIARTLSIDPKVDQPAIATSSEFDQANRTTVGYVPVVAAGTTDQPVAEEAIETLNWMSIGTKQIMDVGVAGPHRLPERLCDLQNADAIIVVAGMEGALPSVVGGYVDCPIIAVPTSVGYGANFGGIAALLSMLNSCAANVTVVNIDAGFKAAYVAGMIATKIEKAKHA